MTKMKFPKLLLLMLWSQFTFAQIKVINLDKSDIPKSVKYKGQIVNSVMYQDSDGENVVITTQTGIIETNDGFRSADLYAYHFIADKDSIRLTWEMHDFIKDCGEDVVAEYLPKSFGVTDLDNNGKAEVWIMYKTACTGDVSPSVMKIIMHEGDKKFAMRGTNRVKVSDKEYAGGNYAFDTSFLNGPGLFRQYAEDLWKNNLLETWNK
jgi:hypothetical protein